MNELFDPERKDKNYTEEYIPQVIEKTQNPEDTQEEIQETLNESGDMYSISTIEPLSRNTATTGLYGDYHPLL